MRDDNLQKLEIDLADRKLEAVPRLGPIFVFVNFDPYWLHLVEDKANLPLS